MSGSNAANNKSTAAGRPALRVVDRSTRLRRKAKLDNSKVDNKSKHANSILIVLSLGLASAVVFGLVLVNISLAQSSLGIAELQRQVSDQRTRQQQLRLEVARSESPERIAQVGADLGLVVPEREHFLQGPSVLASDIGPTGAVAGYELSAARP